MTTTVITSQGAYGQMTNQATARLLQMDATIRRLHAAIATASSGYMGVPGTEFEAVTSTPTSFPVPNPFSVVPSDVPGEQGAAYRFAMDSLHEKWLAFWAEAEPFISQLDNGAQG